MLTALVKLSDIGIIHSDLKLENLMYDGHQLSLIDFGSSIMGEDIQLWPLGNSIQSRYYRHSVIGTFLSLSNFFEVCTAINL
jgi:serine/threonine protein kinase